MAEEPITVPWALSGERIAAINQAKWAVIAAAEALYYDPNAEDARDPLMDAVRKLRALQQPAAPGREHT